MKILSSKKWKKFTDEYIDFQLEIVDLKHDNATYKEQVDTIVSINKDLTNTTVELEEKLKDAKKEIKNLKRKLTIALKQTGASIEICPVKPGEIVKMRKKANKKEE